MMDENEKKEIGQRLTSRLATGLTFLQFHYIDQNQDKVPDGAWIRNIYILLSFYAELLLKAIYITKNQFSNAADLDKRLKNIGHNLFIAGQRIGKVKLLEFGIKDIRFINQEYVIETNDGEFFVKDFNDIRYDFIDGRVRNLKGDENAQFKKQVDIMLAINQILKKLVW